MLTVFEKNKQTKKLSEKKPRKQKKNKSRTVTGLSGGWGGGRLVALGPVKGGRAEAQKNLTSSGFVRGTPCLAFLDTGDSSTGSFIFVVLRT